MREVSFIVFQDDHGCHVAKVENIETFETLIGVARLIKESRQSRKIEVKFITNSNGFSKKEIQETKQILE